MISRLFLILLFCTAANRAFAQTGSNSNPLITIPCSSKIQAVNEALPKVDSLLSENLKNEKIPGMAAGVVCSDTLLWANGYGVWALDNKRKVTPKTLFRIASITKLFTATAVVKLQEKGLLEFDDSVTDHLSVFKIKRPAETGNQPVTIRHLLTHTSGVPRDSRLTDFTRLYQPGREEALRALPDQELQSPPGETYAYSNLGYGVLGELIFEVSGKSYQEYLDHEIFVPLGMSKTLVHPTPEDSTAWGHGPLRIKREREKAGFWDLGFATPAGSMASPVRELSRFMIQQLAPYTDAKPTLLNEESIRNMHKLHHVVDSTRGGAGLGWGIEISSYQHLVYHGGELPEQTSFMLIDLQGQVGIVILTNAQDVDTNGLAQQSLQIIRRAIVGPGVWLPSEAIP